MADELTVIFCTSFNVLVPKVGAIPVFPRAMITKWQSSRSAMGTVMVCPMVVDVAKSVLPPMRAPVVLSY